MKTAVVLICADAEWQAVTRLLPDEPLQKSRCGDYFMTRKGIWNCIFFQTGWGKIGAASGAQYAIDRFNPDFLINFGTCGGFSGQIESGQIVLAKETVVYDILEQMGNPEEHIAFYSTQIDLSWLPDQLPLHALKAVLVSADKDLIASEIPELIMRYKAVAGDWESGAIAWVAQRSGLRPLIVRGVTDLVDESGSPAYGNEGLFIDAAEKIMEILIGSLPDWLELASLNYSFQNTG